jgi:tol-pal system protein YbgF
MQIIKIVLFGIALSMTTLVFADVPVVDGYSDSSSGSSTTVQNSSANQNSNVQTYGADQSSAPQASNNSNNSQMSMSDSSNSDAAMTSSLSMKDRVTILEKQVNNLKQMLSQMNSMQQQMQAMQGQLDTQTHNMQAMQDQVKSQYQDLDQRLTNSSSAAASTDDSIAKPKAKSAKKAAATDTASNDVSSNDLIVDDKTDAKTADNSAASSDTVAQTDTQSKIDKANQLASSPAPVTKEQGVYQSAFNLLKNKQYPEAATAFQKYLKKYPTAKNNVNAHYWLGQLYLLQGQPDNAIAQLKTILKNNPDDAKVPDTMVQLGLAYYAKGDSTHAKGMLAQVQQKYPDSPAAKLAQTRLHQMAQMASSNASSDSE